jgi:hypothetical protein
MAGDGAPLWRRAYDQLDKELSPRIDALVRSESFLREIGRLSAVRRQARSQVSTVASRVWHLVNLPAGSDVARLTGQVGALDRQVRNLTLQLEQERRRSSRDDDANREDDDGPQPESAGPIGPDPARRRT